MWPLHTGWSVFGGGLKHRFDYRLPFFPYLKLLNIILIIMYDILSTEKINVFNI